MCIHIILHVHVGGFYREVALYRQVWLYIYIYRWDQTNVCKTTIWGYTIRPVYNVFNPWCNVWYENQNTYTPWTCLLYFIGIIIFFFNYITERKSERSHLTHPGGNQHPLQEGSLELPHRVALQLGVELHLLGSRRLQGGNLGPLQEGSLEPLPLAARRV